MRQYRRNELRLLDAGDDRKLPAAARAALDLDTEQRSRRSGAGSARSALNWSVPPSLCLSEAISTALDLPVTGNPAQGYYSEPNVPKEPSAMQKIIAYLILVVGGLGLASRCVAQTGVCLTITGGAAQCYGQSNTGVGLNALMALTYLGNPSVPPPPVIGDSNIAAGVNALYTNTGGNNNSAVGYNSLYSNTTGNYGTALGYEALNNSQSGLANIGVGPFAGRNIVQGQLNIDIGSWGSVDESNTIRIGTPQYHRTTYIAGIGNSVVPGGTPVVVNQTTGQLGYAGSSERYKADVHSLGTATDRLSQLRPVSFHIRTDPNGALQYGLIAEEVVKVYPELVIRDEDGTIQGVRYDELAPLLVNELQRQAARIEEEHRAVVALAAQHAADAVKLEAATAEIRNLQQQVGRVNELERQLGIVLDQLKAEDQRVARR